MGMILGQSVDVVLHRIESGRRQIPRLTHPAAHHLANPSRLFDKRRIAQKHTAHRRTQALTQTQRYALKQFAIRLGILLFRHDGIHQTGAIQVKAKTMRIAQ